jgi:ABC-type Fe3+ transport system permease subunit
MTFWQALIILPLVMVPVYGAAGWILITKVKPYFDAKRIDDTGE